MDADWEYIDSEEVKNYIHENGVSGIKEFFKKKLERWKDVEINIGITGDSGTGKSSFINTIRELDDDDEMAAEVGIIETTTEPSCFPHPTNSKIQFWDLPGIGTPNYPDLETYSEKAKLEKYDMFLIFTAGRFTGNDLELAKKIRSVNKKFFFIRTKIDENVRAEKQSRKRSFDEERMLSKIREDCYKNLVGLVEDVIDIFLISNHQPEKWDFVRLTEAILDVLPAQQRQCLTLSIGILRSLSTDILQRKIQILKSRMWMVSSASCVAAMVPLPGVSIVVDLVLLTTEIAFYRSQLGLPVEGSDRFLKMSAVNQEIVRRFCFTTAAEMAALLVTFSAESAIEEVTRFIPIVGLFIAGTMSFGSTFFFLRHSLNKLEKTAFSVLDDFTAESVDDLDID